MKISVIIPTVNRHQKLKETVEKLRRQDFSADEYEIVVVDDGSQTPVSFPEDFTVSPKLSVVRLEGEERSVARNTGAKNSTGELLVFVDDDVAVGDNFLSAHWRAHQEFPDVLAVGAILLPEEDQSAPFVRFRQNLERNGVPPDRGIIKAKNFCTAQNMSIRRNLFQDISGFDVEFTSGEDQDFALRHSTRGRKIAFLPEALGIHYDKAFDIRAYCRRHEWGTRMLLPFLQRYPDFPDNIERRRVNDVIRWGEEPFSQVFRKSVKSVLSTNLVINSLFRVADILERIAPRSPLLERIYQLLLGAHIFRGYRAAIGRDKVS